MRGSEEMYVTPISYITPVASGVNGIAFASGIGAAAVGNGGAIFTWNNTNYNQSYGFPVWESQTSGVTTDLLGICYSPTFQLFVVCGRNGVILTSANGYSWSQAEAVTLADLHSVAENSGILLAVGGGGVGVSSIDGANWLLKDVPAPLTAQELVLTIPKGAA